MPMPRGATVTRRTRTAGNRVIGTWSGNVSKSGRDKVANELMRSPLIGLFAVILGCAACSRSHPTTAQQGDDALDLNGWKPTAAAIQAAERQKKSPPMIVATAPPKSIDYKGSVGVEDPELGGIEKLPPRPMPKLASGDEADQFCLPEWERMARGELHIKRIR